MFRRKAFAKSSIFRKNFYISDFALHKPAASVKVQIGFHALYAAGVSYAASASLKACGRARIKHLVDMKFSSVLPDYRFRNYKTEGVEIGFHADIGFHMNLIRGKFVYIISF